MHRMGCTVRIAMLGPTNIVLKERIHAKDVSPRGDTEFLITLDDLNCETRTLRVGVLVVRTAHIHAIGFREPLPLREFPRGVIGISKFFTAVEEEIGDFEQACYRILERILAPEVRLAIVRDGDSLEFTLKTRRFKATERRMICKSMFEEFFECGHEQGSAAIPS